MSVLLLGAGGQLGKELSAKSVIAYDRAGADVENHDRIATIFEQHKPRIVINASAYTAVDKAEQETEKAFSVNSGACRNLAALCRKHSSKLVHFSTDYVFDGNSSSPYLETDSPAPINVYGRSKLEGELAIAEELSEHVILRVSWLFGPYGNNFAKTMLRLAGDREELRVVADQTGCPCSAFNLSEAAWSIVLKLLDGADGYGTFHYADQPATTWHGFAEKVLECARRNGLPVKASRVVAINTSDFPTPAARPQHSVLDCAKLARVWGIVPAPWEAQIARTLGVGAE